MNFKELSVARYSVRKFSDRPAEPEKLQAVLEACRVCPTAHNNQPQHVFVLKSPEALEKVKTATAFSFGAPVILAVVYDQEKSWHREVDGKDHGEIDAALSVGQMMLQAADLGLGTTCVCVFDPSKLIEAFPQIGRYVPVALIPLGYPAENAHPSRGHSDRKPLQDFYTEL